jgi:hypothetical protein
VPICGEGFRASNLYVYPSTLSTCCHVLTSRPGSPIHRSYSFKGRKDVPLAREFHRAPPQTNCGECSRLRFMETQLTIEVFHDAGVMVATREKDQNHRLDIFMMICI